MKNTYVQNKTDGVYVYGEQSKKFTGKIVIDK
jgi:hypothetical protein